MAKLRRFLLDLRPGLVERLLSILEKVKGCKSVVASSVLVGETG